jgi:membrane protease YdiL (CAAX protease family)
MIALTLAASAFSPCAPRAAPGRAPPYIVPPNAGALTHARRVHADALRLEAVLETPPPSSPPPPPPSSPPPTTYAEVAAGVALFVMLQSVFLSFASVAGADTGESGGAVAACRLLATASFFAVQQAAGTRADEWLQSDATTDGERSRASALLRENPAAPAAAALAFALALAAAGTALGVEWLPPARPLPEAGRALDVLVVAPLTEEAVFRAWLLRALDRAGAAPAASFAASAALFSLWHAPQSVVTGDASALVFFAALGAWLALLYRTAGDSLRVAAGTHASFNLIVVLLRAARA